MGTPEIHLFHCGCVAHHPDGCACSDLNPLLRPGISITPEALASLESHWHNMAGLGDYPITQQMCAALAELRHYREIRGLLRLRRQEMDSVYHAPDCPVAQPGFVPTIDGPTQCRCDFMQRLKVALDHGFCA